ncbi:sugar-binding domain-containing protein [Fusibacter sp. 3D3]|uniref:sugar-binding domain-containing protein n=1 Tax=Fusibacter sp. 3D3 TaxID=1048380 RepID=UPI000852C4B0|nr:sugar-binding domain-containing protein [Fusibacter sp. 3D3]GAU76825.1 hypothetical protein F3D3_1423 [Fusibacter sp. 3D3]
MANKVKSELEVDKHLKISVCRFLDLDVNDNVIGIQTDDIENHKNILLVAGGPSKAKAIYAALKGGYINTLVSDHETLETILELNQKNKKK